MVLPLRERVLQATQHGSFYCRPDELGRFNMEPNAYYHIDGAEPARGSAEDGLAELEREGLIRRGRYWGPTRLEMFYEGRTLYAWIASKK